jgi:hypothetical protein
MNLQLLAKPSSIVSHSFHILALTSDKQENEATIKYLANKQAIFNEILQNLIDLDQTLRQTWE